MKNCYKQKKKEEEIKLHVSSVQNHWPVSMNRQAKLKSFTSQDNELQQLAKYILHGWPKKYTTIAYSNLMTREEI